MKRTNTILFFIVTAVLTMAVVAGPASAASGYEWLNSTAGSDPATASSPPTTVTVTEASSGFSWADAFIGAGIALAVVLILGVTFYEVRRHARVTTARA